MAHVNAAVTAVWHRQSLPVIMCEAQSIGMVLDCSVTLLPERLPGNVQEVVALVGQAYAICSDDSTTLLQTIASSAKPAALDAMPALRRCSPHPQGVTPSSQDLANERLVEGLGSGRDIDFIRVSAALFQRARVSLHHMHAL